MSYNKLHADLGGHLFGNSDTGHLRDCSQPEQAAVIVSRSYAGEAAEAVSPQRAMRSRPFCRRDYFGMPKGKYTHSLTFATRI